MICLNVKKPRNKILIVFLIFLCVSLSFINNKILRMQEGTVKFFNGAKGFGFISPSAGGPDVFVHVSGLVSEIRENDKVSYEVQNGQKGLNAINVSVI